MKETKNKLQEGIKFGLGIAWFIFNLVLTFTFGLGWIEKLIHCPECTMTMRLVGSLEEAFYLLLVLVSWGIFINILDLSEES